MSRDELFGQVVSPSRARMTKRAVEKVCNFLVGMVVL